MAEDVLTAAKANGARWIATSDYPTYGVLQWHIGRDIPVVQINERARFLDFAPLDPARFQGRALYVHLRPSIDPAGELTPLPSLAITWRGKTMKSVELATLDGFTPELNPPPGSPAFVTDPSVPGARPR